MPSSAPSFSGLNAIAGRRSSLPEVPCSGERLQQQRRSADVGVALLGLVWTCTSAYSYGAGGSWPLFVALIVFSFGALVVVTAQAALEDKAGPLPAEFLRRCAANTQARAFLNAVQAQGRPLTEGEYALLNALVTAPAPVDPL